MKPLFVEIKRHSDHRGTVSKISLTPASALGDVKEILFSRSSRGVIRGFHYQTGSSAGQKLVWCLEGEILDVCFEVSERRSEPPFLHTNLLGPDKEALLIPKGFAHGFECLSATCTVGYLLFESHQPSEDLVIDYRSFGRWWTSNSPILSDRDKDAPPFFAGA
jgi:dTDP-4-dehydrorhamnose 3,5-epimerase